MTKKTVFRVLAVTAAVATTTLLAAPGANADTRTGWVGSTGPVNGNLFLHTSTVSNTPLFADTHIYTAFGNAVPSATIGVRSRLFKSGALCVINPYKFNSGPTSSLTDPTSGDCGPGWYNSHGFVRAWNGSDYQEFVTFPSDPLEFGAAAAVSTNDRGETVGSAEGVADDADLPDLVSAYGTDGTLGYVRSGDIAEPALSRDQVLSLPVVDTAEGEVLQSTPRTVPLYEQDGVTVIGQFRIG